MQMEESTTVGVGLGSGEGLLRSACIEMRAAFFVT